MKTWFNRNKVHFAIIGIFIAICFVYFMPIWQGKVLQQTDVTQAQAMQHEIMTFKEKDGKAPLWTNAMFSGMPSYQIWVSFPKNIGTHIMSFFKTVVPYPMDAVLFYLIGAYILFSVLKIRPWLAAVGAVAFAFTSYNFIYIEAGHASKAYAIGFFAPVLAGVILSLRGRYILGASLLAFALALEIRVNHIQTTYYLFIAILILMIIELVYAIKTKALLGYFKSVAFMFVAAMIALGVNAGLLLTTYEYSHESIRGKANIANDGKEANQQGVDRDYAYRWSQGVGESITFLIPNAYGGGMRSLLDEDSEVAKVLASRGIPAGQAKSIGTYWGDKPFTSGPWYFGAIVIFLFVLGLFIVKGKFKWWILAATLLSVFLSFGRHLPFISDLFFDYFPLYKSFRAVESNLVVASFLIPILAVVAVEQLLVDKKNIVNLDKKFLYALGIVGGITLLVWFVPSLFFDFRNADHNELVQNIAQQSGDNGFAQSLGNALIQDRIGIAQKDAFRSLAFVLLAAGLIWLYIKNKLQASFLVFGLGILILIDMWGVDNRYLNKESFVDKSVMANQIKPREVDELIMMDKDPNYRVLDLTDQYNGPFNTATYAYYHKMIGGYHAAKLMRYQELIENQFSKSINEDVLDMLNTRYLIVNDRQNNSQRIQRRSSALGNAWFVDKITYVKDDQQEMDGINSFDPRREAFVNEAYKPQIEGKKLGLATNGSIALTSYRPDYLVYEYSVPNNVFAVFSEIYYSKGWKAFVDGEETPIMRADYLLRALQLPGGNHKIEFKFEPQSYYTGETISLIASIVLIIGLALGIWLESKRDKGKVKSA
ncbi:YfhO family protein [Olivibacter sitiensis]|uniref:YfhO family protein n=1 Tax=Olivibacter sitiensis TaxID=376470 RepID=UPI00041DEF61|nr:YfhO family protein [Olivibacter sitiensis]